MGLLTASWKVEGVSGESSRLGLDLRAAEFGGCQGSLRHRVLRLGRGRGEDVLQAQLTLRNESGKEQAVAFEFATSARPYAYDDQVRVHFPLSTIGLENPG